MKLQIARTEDRTLLEWVLSPTPNPEPAGWGWGLGFGQPHSGWEILEAEMSEPDAAEFQNPSGQCM